MKKRKRSGFNIGAAVICIHGYNGYSIGDTFIVIDNYKDMQDDKYAIRVRRQADEVEGLIKTKYIVNL